MSGPHFTYVFPVGYRPIALLLILAEFCPQQIIPQHLTVAFLIIVSLFRIYFAVRGFGYCIVEADCRNKRIIIPRYFLTY